MTKQEVDEIVNQYKGEMITDRDWFYESTQYDDRSAVINYSFIRHFKPTCVLEFGTRTGRCTTDIFNALIKNKKFFTFKPYEIDYGLRLATQANVKTVLGLDMLVGGDVTQDPELPNNIDYLFVDNCHDLATTEWVFETLLKNCVPGAIVQIHDVPLREDFYKGKTGLFPETDFIIKLHKEGRLPLEKMYWANEENPDIESTWWRYKPCA